MLRLAPALTVAVFLAPILAGLAATVFPALGYPPAAGPAPSLDAWRALVMAPGFAASLGLTIWTGLASTLLSLGLAVGFCATAAASQPVARLRHGLAPLLATPHAAMAIGLAFVIAPSGWIARAVSPGLTGWTVPPAIVVDRDPFGLALILGLAMKETPFLALIILAAEAQARTDGLLRAARSLGYGPARAWLAVVFPVIWRQLRLPVAAVLAFSLSVVDMALVLAPGAPPPLAVLAARWFTGYDLVLYGSAAAAGLLIAGVVMLAMAAGWVGEQWIRRLGTRWLSRGRRRGLAEPALAAAAGIAALLGLLGLGALVAMAVWSVAGPWRFPDAWPAALELGAWRRAAAGLAAPAGTTLALAATATAVALALALACLENEQRRALRPGRGALWLIYLPLIVPQIAFLSGLQILLVRLDADGSFAAVAAAHLVFVLPYVFLALADPFRSLDPRYGRVAAALGAGPSRVFWRVKLPLLARPVATAAAVGIAVSVAQYLPTLFAGAGRVSTLTTDAVTLSSGGDRRVLGVYTLLQSAIPLVAYGLALLAPRWPASSGRGAP
jgi:putative thiamine transport system permease protein